MRAEGKACDAPRKLATAKDSGVPETRGTPRFDEMLSPDASAEDPGEMSLGLGGGEKKVRLNKNG